MRIIAGRFPSVPADTSLPTFHDRLSLDHLFFDVPAGWMAIGSGPKDSYASDHHPLVAMVGRD